jgi:phospholipid transport system substrate-binding protein
LTSTVGEELMTMLAISIGSRLGLPLAAGALALILIGLAQVPNATASQDAGAFVSKTGTQGIEALRSDVAPAERLDRFRRLLQQDFDVPGIGLFALGRYRLRATPQEQQEFFRLYPDFTVRALSSRLNEYSGSSFRVTSTRAIGNETVVSSEIVRSNGSRVLLDWHLIDGDGQYRVADVAVGGVSMKITLRDQFASWIENNGGRFGALLSVLRQQIAQAR